MTTTKITFETDADKINKVFKRDRKFIVAVDFDGTIANMGLDGMLCPNMSIINLIKYIKEEMHVILWTCRQGEMLQAAIDFCASQGLVFDYVNENVDKSLPDCRKIFADIYIDDCAIKPTEKNKLYKILKREVKK